MKRPTMLVKALLQEAARDLDLSVERDLARVQDRCKHEGLSFLTITLPTLSDALERGLEVGSFTCPTNFSRHGTLPRFLGGLFKRVFAKDGRLLPDACPNSVFWIRQICRFFKKLKIACSPSRNMKAIKHFLEVEGELRTMTPSVEREDNVLDTISGILWAEVFPQLDYTDLVCHHGPGVTADRYLSNERYRIRRWNHRSEYTFPSDLHCYPNYGAAAEACRTGEGTVGAEGIEELRIRDELPVRVVFVPKTQTAPRVIAIEPSHMQYMQQSVKDYVYKALEGHSLTRRSIRFSDQTVNQRLAYQSSIDQRLSTLDLKDASDRVHLHLVQRIFKNSDILPFLEDSRSLHATLPNEQNILLFKFASMGSALCFPVEAMVFYTLVQSAMHQLDGRRPSSRSIRDYSRSIDIYGDDIIIPTRYTDVVVRYLESYALKVNVNKSFSKGNFRESCGADFYKGVAVNPVYARTVPHDNARDWGAETVMSWNATADLFYMRGYWHVAQTIRDMLSRVVRRTIPKTRKLGSGLAFFSYLFTTGLRYDRDLQCWKQKRLHFDPIKRKDRIDGDELACLNKWGLHVFKRQLSLEADNHSNPYRYRFSGADAPLDRQSQDGSWFSDSSGDSQCRLGHEDRVTHTRVDDFCVRDLPVNKADETGEYPVLSAMAGSGDGEEPILCESSSTRSGFNYSADYCLTESVQSDPLRHLYGDSFGLDFLTSTKRGSFKSKCRWVSLAG